MSEEPAVGPSASPARSHDSPVMLTQVPAEPGLTELPCPHCDYNLLGSPVGVCPECGMPFDREQLVDWMRSDGRLLPRRAADFWPVEAQVVGMSLGMPSKLGRLLPPLPNARRAFAIGMCMRLASIIPATLAVASLETKAIAGLIMAVPGVIVGSLFTEWTIAALLTWMVKPIAVPPGKSWRFWRCCCHLFSTHLIMSSSWLALIIADAASDSHMVDKLMPLLPLVVIGPPMLYWWACLSRAVRRRGVPCIGRAVACVVIPFVGFVGLIVGIFAGAFAAECAGAIMR